MNIWLQRKDQREEIEFKQVNQCLLSIALKNLDLEPTSFIATCRDYLLCKEELTRDETMAACKLIVTGKSICSYLPWQTVNYLVKAHIERVNEIRTQNDD